MTTTILIIINVFSALAIIVLALMQQSKGDMGSAFGGGGSQSMFGSRGSANFLSRSTSIMCVVFFATSLALAYVYAKRADANSVIKGGDSVIETTVDAVDSEVPTIKDSSVPSLPESATETIESEVPSLPDTTDAVENAVEEVESEVPATPQ